MKNSCLLAALVFVAVTLAACKKENRTEQLAALDSAYQSGVLSKAEYDAKRQQLGGTPPPAPPAPAPAPAPAPVTPPVPPPVAQPVEPSSPPAASPPPKLPPPPSAAAETEPEPKPLAGCDDAEYKSSSVKGAIQRFFPAPIESVRKAAHAALESLDFSIHKEAGNDIEASKRRHIGAVVGAGGERLILHFERSRQGNHSGTMVTGETKKSFVGRLAQRSWTNALLAQIACHLRETR